VCLGLWGSKQITLQRGGSLGPTTSGQSPNLGHARQFYANSSATTFPSNVEQSIHVDLTITSSYHFSISVKKMCFLRENHRFEFESA
jgi:hypothetical protein